MSGYELIDSGNGRKLERVGEWLLDRQAPQAVWKPALAEDEWKQVDAYHVRDERGGGRWRFHRELPDSWVIDHRGMKLVVKPTPFGHLGLFAEQDRQWQWLEKVARQRREAGREMRLINFFAYSGIASLFAARGGAEVCHVDAAKGIVDWARGNARESGLENRPIRWIVEDASRFAQRELQRGRRYDAIVLDPPSYGRGAKKEVWRIEEDLPPLLECLARLLSDDPAFVLLSGHTPGWTPTVLRHLLTEVLPERHTWAFEGGEMITPASRGRDLPAGHFLRAISGVTPDPG